MSKLPDTSLRKVLEDSPIGVAIIDPSDLKRMYINSTCAKIFGATTGKEFLKYDIAESWVNQDDFKRALSIFEKGEVLVNFEAERQRIDGSRFWVLMNAQPIEFEGKNASIIWAIDITEQKVARERAEHLKTAINQLDEGVVIFDKDDRILAFNDAWQELNDITGTHTGLGIIFEDHLRASIKSGLIPESAGSEEQWLRERMERHNNPSGPFEVARQDGRWIRVNEQALPKGGTILIVSDITELKQTEETLRKALERSQWLINAIDRMTETVAIYDHEDRMVFCNQIFRDRNQSLAEYIAPGDDYECFLRGGVAKGIFLDAIGQEEAWISKRMEQHRACGEPFTVVRNDSYLLINEQRLPDGGLATLAIDISTQKLAEEKAKASEARLQEVFAIAPEAIITVGSDMNIQMFNASAELIFGYRAEEIVGRSIDVLMPERFRQKHSSHMQGFVVSQGTFRFMEERDGITGLRKDGVEFPASASVSKLEIGGEKIYTVMLHDITQRKRAEESTRNDQKALQIQASELKRLAALSESERQRAEAANVSKSMFLANMSHEIRTPMNGVVGMVDVLTQMEMEPEQHRMIQTIRNSSFALLRIIDDVLDASKIEAGKLDLENVPVQLHQTIESVVETMVPTADDEKVRLSLFIDPMIPKWILSDAGRLRQIMLNLLNNAIKFSRPIKDGTWGHVDIRTMFTLDNCLQFKVVDDGIGMREDVCEKLFKPFSQAEESTTRKFGGTGLGLLITYNLLEMMDGTISVDSTPGEGSTFTTTLPLVEAGMNTVIPDISGLNLLALVDDVMRRDILSGYVEHGGSTIRFAKNEAELATWVEAEKDETIILLAQETMTENDRIRETLSNGTEQRRFLSCTSERSDKLGLVQPNCYVIRRLPILPSEFLLSLAVLAGRESPDVDVPAKGLNALADAPSIDEAEALNRLILLVEDNETNQQVIMYQLDMLGYTAEVANDGQQGFDLYKTGRFDLVLTDCHMPVMDGFEMTDAIRKIEKANDLSRIPIVAITANALHGEADHCLASGMDDYLSKPVELKRLDTTLVRWLPV